MTDVDIMKIEISNQLATLTQHFNPSNPQLEVDHNDIIRRMNRLDRDSEVPKLLHLLRRTLNLRRRIAMQDDMRMRLKERRDAGLDPAGIIHRKLTTR